MRAVLTKNDGVQTERDKSIHTRYTTNYPLILGTYDIVVDGPFAIVQELQPTICFAMQRAVRGLSSVIESSGTISVHSVHLHTYLRYICSRWKTTSGTGVCYTQKQTVPRPDKATTDYYKVSVMYAIVKGTYHGTVHMWSRTLSSTFMENVSASKEYHRSLPSPLRICAYSSAAVAFICKASNTECSEPLRGTIRVGIIGSDWRKQFSPSVT